MCSASRHHFSCVCTFQGLGQTVRNWIKSNPVLFCLAQCVLWTLTVINSSLLLEKFYTTRWCEKSDIGTVKCPKELCQSLGAVDFDDCRNKVTSASSFDLRFTGSCAGRVSPSDTNPSFFLCNQGQFPSTRDAKYCAAMPTFVSCFPDANSCKWKPTTTNGDLVAVVIGGVWIVIVSFVLQFTVLVRPVRTLVCADRYVYLVIHGFTLTLFLG